MRRQRAAQGWNRAAAEAVSIDMSKQTIEAAALKLGQLRYREPCHAELPHLVSFSGGRSSAALTFMAAEEGLLRPDRRDAVLFANTSAEHPGTYEFAAECKQRLETEFGLPFFWYEFCTVEDAWRGDYWRKASYRLVKPLPVEQDSDGYRSSGELFEEFVSLQGMLPNPHSRTCTAKLKLYPSHDLIGEWLGGTEGPAHAGHHWQQEQTAGGGG
ncbi:MAG: phosphoadenosine phosphosulfate reductase family protein [Acidimicrobiaceae bacterium]|nr:phosphoadenosine phosphosulfate reductase family protein [Acidimicrobiaceae bacterium]